MSFQFRVHWGKRKFSLRLSVSFLFFKSPCPKYLVISTVNENISGQWSGVFKDSFVSKSKIICILLSSLHSFFRRGFLVISELQHICNALLEILAKVQLQWKHKNVKGIKWKITQKYILVPLCIHWKTISVTLGKHLPTHPGKKLLIIHEVWRGTIRRIKDEKDFCRRVKWSNCESFL